MKLSYKEGDVITVGGNPISDLLWMPAAIEEIEKHCKNSLDPEQNDFYRRVLAKEILLLIAKHRGG